jgi:hypothetical protein
MRAWFVQDVGAALSHATDHEIMGHYCIAWRLQMRTLPLPACLVDVWHMYDIFRGSIPAVPPHTPLCSAVPQGFACWRVFATCLPEQLLGQWLLLTFCL